MNSVDEALLLASNFRLESELAHERNRIAELQRKFRLVLSELDKFHELQSERDDVLSRLAKVESESADKEAALADVAIVLDVMAFSLVFARLFVRESEPLADACLSQIKCGLEAYISVVGDDALMTEIVKNSAAYVDNQNREV